MKKITPLFAILLLALGTTAFANSTPLNTEDIRGKAFIESVNEDPEADQWKTFSKNLVVALKSENDGVSAGAMGLVIRFSEKVDVSDALFDVVSIYRNHEDENMRRMALVTLGKMDSPQAIGFLTRAEQFEKSDVLRQTMRAVIHDYQRRHEG
ncbi:MAG: HEAT repeat domain-containing protein [Bacteroidota bacterium]